MGSKDIGKEVFVGTVGKGKLRYIGSIKGKQGLFCGVELEKPEGKHDGTYQGKHYQTSQVVLTGGVFFCLGEGGAF